MHRSTPRGLRFSIAEFSAFTHTLFIVLPLAAGQRLSVKRLILQRVENPDGITTNVDLW